ncbi:hypothetical protein CDIK_4140 [Cucumispora dikerogammari]|nr:hypothetical protein CDIK_4140 [Cucumispora dikerogammari]
MSLEHFHHAKKTKLHKKAINAPRSKELRKKYANYFLNDLTIEDKYIIFIDESPFNLSMRRNYEKSRTGTRATAVIPTNRGRNLPSISAINGEKVLYSVVIEGGQRLGILNSFFWVFCSFF